MSFSFDAELFYKSYTCLTNTLDSINSLTSSLNSINSFDPKVDGDISRASNMIKTIGSDMEPLVDDSNRVINILRMFNQIGNDGDFDAFDDDSFNLDVKGFYGAQQGLPSRTFKRYLVEGTTGSEIGDRHVGYYIELFNEHGITDENEMAFYLDILDHKGCGYSVISNTVIDYYKNNPEAFEEKYGYPLYDINPSGKKANNYDTLIVDVFLDINDDKLDDAYWDSFPDDGEAISGFSVRGDKMGEYLAHTFEGEATVTSSRNDEDISIEEYEIVTEGNQNTYAAIAVKDFDLVPYGPNKDKYEGKHVDGGHWMSIVGVSENGNYIVSSWGYEFELIGGTPDKYSDNPGGIVYYSIGDN